MLNKTLPFLALCVALCSVANYANAQTDAIVPPVTDSMKVKPAKTQNADLNFGLALHLNIGTTGPGGAIGVRITDNFSCRVGFSYFALAQDIDADFFEVNAKHSPDITLGAASLLVDYFPLAKSSFHLTGGLAYNLNRYKYALAYNDNLTFGAVTINGENAGTISADIRSSRIAPYLGIGFGRAVPNKRVGFGVELGCFYHGKPQVSIDATKLVEQTKDEQQQLQDNLNGYRFYPYLNMHLTIKVTK